MSKQGKAYYHTSIKNVTKEIPVYRYIPLKHLLELIQNSELTISQTQCWDDIYENFLSKSIFYFEKTPVSFVSFLPCYYGQCWTLTKESDALWRIYSPDKSGVRIKSSINRLLEASLKETDFEQHSTSIRIVGIVQYLTENSIINWINKLDKLKINATTLIESLFIKRKEFSHEREVRLIVQKVIKEEDENMGTVKKHLRLSIDPNQFIDEVSFDPRLSDKDFETYSQVLKAVGYKNKVEKSNLYSLRQLEFRK